MQKFFEVYKPQLRTKKSSFFKNDLIFYFFYLKFLSLIYLVDVYLLYTAWTYCNPGSTPGQGKLKWKIGRAVEGACLEYMYTGNRI